MLIPDEDVLVEQCLVDEIVAGVHRQLFFVLTRTDEFCHALSRSVLVTFNLARVSHYLPTPNKALLHLPHGRVCNDTARTFALSPLSWSSMSRVHNTKICVWSAFLPPGPEAICKHLSNFAAPRICYHSSARGRNALADNPSIAVACVQ